MSSKSKNIYEFNVFVPRSVTEEEVTQGEGGEEIVTRKKVEKKVPVNIVIREPNRKILEESENFHSKEYNRFMRDGFMTRAQISKMYEDQGGAFSEARIKDMQNRFSEIPNLEKEASNIESESKSKKESGDNEGSDELASKASAIRDKMKKLEDEFASIQSSFNQIYEHSCDTKALNSLIRWLILMLAHIEENGVVKPLFVGKDYKEKSEYEYKLADDNDEIYKLCHSKLAGIISYWYFRRDIVSEKEFSDLLLKIDKGEF